MRQDPWTETLVPLLARQDGLVTSVQARAGGATAEMLRGWVSARRLVRLRRNVLVDAELWQAAAPWERHLIRARGLMLDRREQVRAGRRTGKVALSHHSALAVMGLSIHGADDLVHVVAVGGDDSRRRSGLVQHACVGKERIVDAFGLPTVTPAVACAQVAAAFGVEAGLVAADSALRLGRCTREDLESLLGWSWLGRGRRCADIVLRRADGRHESAGESRTAWVLHRLGFEQVRPQVEIRAGDGS